MGVKKFFRFLRGELNGFYLQRLSYFINTWIDNNINSTLCYMANIQFELGKISKEDIFNISKFAGITQTLAQGTLLTNLLLMTTSENIELEDPCFSATGSELTISFAKQISERGLYNVPNEQFDFRYWNQNSKDIVDFATPNLQASMVPDGYKKEGYVKAGDIIYDKQGNFIPSAIHKDTPPTDGTPYSDYYGQQFLQLGEEYLVYRAIPEEILYNIVLIIQRIRYNGSSVKTFAELTSLIVGKESGEGQDFITLVAHEFKPATPLFVTWKYKIDSRVVNYKLVRLEAWKSLVESFFPQIVLVETVDTAAEIKE